MIENFEKMRLDLITRLENGEISKAEYLEKSFAFFDGRNFSEPDTISNLDDGIFYYYYFNTLAKYCMMRYKSENNSSLATIANEYYEIKENVFSKIICLLKSEDVKAYYVELGSVKLKKRLVEIVLMDREKLIFHTLRADNIRRLKNLGYLGEGIRKSLISDYINTKYY